MEVLLDGRRGHAGAARGPVPGLMLVHGAGIDHRPWSAQIENPSAALAAPTGWRRLRPAGGLPPRSARRCSSSTGSGT